MPEEQSSVQGASSELPTVFSVTSHSDKVPEEDCPEQGTASFSPVVSPLPPIDELPLLPLPTATKHADPVPIFQLPDYVTPLPSNVSETDMQYLASKGVFSIPDGTIRDALIRAYIESVYPGIPGMQLDQFLCAINNDGSSGTVSLLLLQAVMLGGATFVDFELLKQAGYESREAAKKDRYHMCRVCHHPHIFFSVYMD